MYGGALYEYENTFLRYMKLEDMGRFTICDVESKESAKFDEIRAFGQNLK